VPYLANLDRSRGYGRNMGRDMVGLYGRRMVGNGSEIVVDIWGGLVHIKQ
jgi:hypothetical protein